MYVCVRVWLLCAAFTSVPRSVDVSGYNSQVCAILGAQWGDEGKGKLVDILAKKSLYIRRQHEGAKCAAPTGLVCAERGDRIIAAVLTVRRFSSCAATVRCATPRIDSNLSGTI